MIQFKSVSDFQSFRKQLSGKIGFVPTMGALHEGHVSLVRTSKSETDFTVCSIFVNPIQFNNPEDFQKYPQVLEKDLLLLEKEGCDAVFIPSAQEMYPVPPRTKFDFGSLETVMEGAFRPGHFNGVAIVVSKLFHIVQPDVAFFGRKDLQQTLVVRQLVMDLQFPLQIKVCDTLRERDGLAMSSRNVRLDEDQRKKSPVLYSLLLEAHDKMTRGEAISSIVSSASETLDALDGIRREYFEVVDATTLLPIANEFRGEIAICVAAYFGEIRLIDNLVFRRD